MAVLFPKSIVLDQKAIDSFVQAYQASMDKIASTLKNASAFTIINNQVLLAQIVQELNNLGVDSTQWIHDHIPAQYQQGAEQAIAQMNHLGMVVTTPTLSVINHESVQAIMSDMSNKIGAAMQTITRSSQQIMSDAARKDIRQRIAVGSTLGETRRDVVKGVAQAIKDNGIFALRDAAGKRWQIDVYAEMLATTKMAEARNTGLTDMMQQNGYDLVEVSAHGATDACGMWEGAILSVSGDDPNYDSVDAAITAGLFHPNCKHSLSAVDPDLASRTSSFIRGSNNEYLKPGETLGDVSE